MDGPVIPWWMKALGNFSVMSKSGRTPAAWAAAEGESSVSESGQSFSSSSG